MLSLMDEIGGTNPRRAEPGWPPVVVAGGFQTGVLLMRNLERRASSSRFPPKITP